MCGGGGGGDQTVTQKTELDPAMLRQLYGGTAANPRGGFNTPAGASDPNSVGGGGGGGGNVTGTGTGVVGSDPTLPGYVPAYNAANGHGMPGTYSGTEGIPGNGGLYANGGLVQRYNMGGQVQPQGLAALNQGQMPMMNGQMPNLSDPMTAATLAMAVRSPEMRYGSIMAQPNPNPMMAQSNPMMAQPMQGYAMGGYIEGPGTGTSDSIPAKIYQNGGPVQEARLSDGEFVMTKDAVDGAGGAAQMYRMMHGLERKA